MKYLGFLMVVVLVACKSAQTDLPLLQNCPDGGDCEVQVFKESRLIYKKASNNTSKIEIEQDSDFQVILITYSGDGSKEYKEEIYLQIPLRFKEIQSRNYSLQNQKVIYGKICDCPDKGYEYITSGKLELINLKEFISLHLEIKSSKSQVIKTLDLDI